MFILTTMKNHTAKISKPFSDHASNARGKILRKSHILCVKLLWWWCALLKMEHHQATSFQKNIYGPFFLLEIPVVVILLKIHKQLFT